MISLDTMKLLNPPRLQILVVANQQAGAAGIHLTQLGDVDAKQTNHERKCVEHGLRCN